MTNLNEIISPITNQSANQIAFSSKSCRMSWFLIQENAPKKKYSIIHAIDLVDNSNDIYINCNVKFHRDKNIFDGRIILASDNRNYVEDELIELNRKLMLFLNNNTMKNQDVWFLVQYVKDPSKIVHAVINKKDIYWNTQSSYSHREVDINESDNKKLATVLFVSNKEEELFEEMKILKTNFFNEIFQYPTDDIESKPWLLVQYSCGINNITYSIINESETVWKSENLYSNNIAYLCEDQTIYQAIILKRSLHRDEIDIELQNIREGSLLSIFPLEKNNMNSCIDYSLNVCRVMDDLTNFNCKFMENQPIEKKFNFLQLTDKIQESDNDDDELQLYLNNDNEEAEILKRLELMEYQMQHENMIINNSLASLDRVRSVMNQKISTLNYLMSIVNL